MGAADGLESRGALLPGGSNPRRAGIARLPGFVGGEDVGIQGAGARLFEHVAHLLHPGVVVRRLLVFGWGGGVAIDLAEDKFRRVVLLLEGIEARDTGVPRAEL